jgi:hypothetical protein
VLRGILQRGTRPIAAPVAVAPTPVTPPAAGPSPVAPRPTVVPPRPTLVVPKPAPSSSEPPQPIAATPPMFKSFGADAEAGSPVHSSRRWALAAAAALVASFAVGFAGRGRNHRPAYRDKAIRFRARVAPGSRPPHL